MYEDRLAKRNEDKATRTWTFCMEVSVRRFSNRLLTKRLPNDFVRNQKFSRRLVIVCLLERFIHKAAQCPLLTKYPQF